ncbi:ATP-binding protein [Bacteroides fragilis]|jgi:predicted ATP-dependent endonuclease of OLD family|nr:ATP-binding protein [Bacteroides fragilis]
MISSIHFKNFKVLENYSISLKEFNILVGVNNSGKSTILDALRILQGAYRYASRLKPSHISLPNDKLVFGWTIPDASIPIILENVQSNLTEEPAIIKYRFDSKKQLFIYLFKNFQPVLAIDIDGENPKTAASFRDTFKLNLAIIPTLSPFEIEEDVVDVKYLNRWIGSRRASRLFRNIWFKYPDNFEEFKEKVELTWQGMSILMPEQSSLFSKRLTMFFLENRITREICWAGFGFQVWLQLLTHIINNKNADIIVVDEPEIYLHPDLQHKILNLLRETNAKILLATHSTEIINEAEPNEVLIVDRKYTSARRLNNLLDLQSATDLIGSNQNINLTRLARGKRILFVEGKDLKILSKLSAVAEYKWLFEKTNLTVIPIEGFSQNERISGTNWTFSKIISEEIKIMALFDRDYRCDEEVREFTYRIKKDASYVHVLKRKEIENYLLNEYIIYKTINSILKRRSTSINNKYEEFTLENTKEVLFQLTDKFKVDVLSQIAAHKFRYSISAGSDLATILKNEQKTFEENWHSLDYRFKVIPGKEFLSTLNSFLQMELKIAITHTQICSNMSKRDLDEDILIFFDNIKNNCTY